MSRSTLRRSTASRANAATSASDKLTRSLHHRATNPSTGLPRLDLGHRAREVSESKAHRARRDHLRHDDDVEPAVLRCRGRLPGAPMPVRGRHSRSTVREIDRRATARRREDIRIMKIRTVGNTRVLPGRSLCAVQIGSVIAKREPGRGRRPLGNDKDASRPSIGDRHLVHRRPGPGSWSKRLHRRVEAHFAEGRLSRDESG